MILVIGVAAVVATGGTALLAVAGLLAGIINGPGSLLDRLYDKKGLPRITEMPKATNITIVGSK